MIGRFLGGVTAAVFTTTAVTGIALLIGADFEELGTGWKHLSDWWNKEPEQEVNLGKAEALKGADNITFFKKEPISGSSLQVTTGIAFASIDDVVAGKTINRWCYIQSGNGKFTQRLDLGSQTGVGRPNYTDPTIFTKKQLEGFDLTVEQLASLSRSHCLLEGFDPRKLGDKKLSQVAPKQIVPGKLQKPAQVWNWRRPVLWRRAITRMDINLRLSGSYQKVGEVSYVL